MEILLCGMAEGMGNPLERKALLPTRAQELGAGWKACGGEGSFILCTSLSLMEER